MVKQTQPSPGELLGHHVKYEIDQMVASLRMLGDLKVPQEWGDGWQKALNNALMESFCLHARALFEFFRKPNGAREYAETNYKPFQNVDVSTWVKNLNNQIAHLLEGRTDDDSRKIRDQDRLDMLYTLSNEVEVFKKALKPEYKSINIPSIPKLTIRGLGQSSTTSLSARIA